MGCRGGVFWLSDRPCNSSPRPQPLRFESLSLRTHQTVAPTPGTALQNKIESRLEKSLGNRFNIATPTANGGLSSVHAGGYEVSERRNAFYEKSLRGGGR